MGTQTRLPTQKNSHHANRLKVKGMLWPIEHTSMSADEIEHIAGKVNKPFINLCHQQQITNDLTPYLSQLYVPFATWLRDMQSVDKQTLIVGINGAQGSGKTTLSLLLACVLKNAFGLNVVTLSIDDIYKTRQQRHIMACDMHPLFETRGVPGTHDTALGSQLLDSFKQLKSGASLFYPVFDKGNDDRANKKNWPSCHNKIDIVLFEGWCVGARPQNENDLIRPINSLERNEDKSGAWRQRVNDYLANEYQALFSALDCLVFLKIPNFQSILKWRGLQEQKLIGQQHHESHLMTSTASLQRFIDHYERLTRHQLNSLPTIANLTIDIGDDHQAKRVLFNRG